MQCKIPIISGDCTEYIYLSNFGATLVDHTRQRWVECRTCCSLLPRFQISEHLHGFNNISWARSIVLLLHSCQCTKYKQPKLHPVALIEQGVKVERTCCSANPRRSLLQMLNLSLFSCFLLLLLVALSLLFSLALLLHAFRFLILDQLVRIVHQPLQSLIHWVDQLADVLFTHHRV